MQPWAFLAAVVTLGAAAAWLRLRSGRQPLALLLALAAVAVAAAWGVVDGYDLRKLAAACVMPVGLLWLGLAGLAVRLTAARLGRPARAAWTLVLWLTLAGNVWVGRGLVGWLERDWDRVDPLTLEPFDAVLVLGGGVTLNNGGQVTTGGAGDRLVLAARMFHLGRAAVLVASGPTFPVGGPAVTSVPRMTARVWRELGVPAEAVVLLEGPKATREEVAAFANLLAERRWRRVGLLTSAFHLRRAVRLCRRAGLEVTPLPADFQATVDPPRPVHLVPSGEGLRLTQVACWELLGAAVRR